MDDVLDELIDAFGTAASDVRDGLHPSRDVAGTNPSDDTQVEADVWADELYADRLATVDGVGQFASEERDAIHECGSGVSVTIDPVDGSSNVASNNTVGSILGVYDDALPARGTELVMAAYVVFGHATTLTVARDNTVTEYLVEGGEVVVNDEEATLPATPELYAFGGRRHGWSEAFSRYAEDVAADHKLRYGGALVGEVNQLMEYGGVYAYPSVGAYPGGKLRHQFEAAPMAYVLDAAGGRSFDGKGSILERSPNGLHGRTPVLLGNAELVDEAVGALDGK